MPPPRPVAGQASAEYVALLAVVVVVFAGAAAVGSPPALAASLASAVRHGICLVAGGVCTPREARAAGLAPCLVRARTDRQRLGGRLLAVRLGRTDALLVERRSDGSAAVSFADGERAGAIVGIGVRLPAGPRIGADYGGGLQFSSGRTWEFPSFAAAARFVRRWAPRESLGGETVRWLRRACPVCHHRTPHMPEADATYREGGAYAEFAAALRGSGLRGRIAGGELEGEVGGVVGRRLGRDGRVTWYDRVDSESLGRLGALFGAARGARGERGVARGHARPWPAARAAAARRGALARRHRAACRPRRPSATSRRACAARRRRRAVAGAASRRRSRST